MSYISSLSCYSTSIFSCLAYRDSVIQCVIFGIATRRLFRGVIAARLIFTHLWVNLGLICSKIYQYLLLIWIFFLFHFLSFPCFHSFSDWYCIALISPTRARIHPILYHPQILNLEIWQVKIFLDLNFPSVVH